MIDEAADVLPLTTAGACDFPPVPPLELLIAHSLEMGGHSCLFQALWRIERVALRRGVSRENKFAHYS